MCGEHFFRSFWLADSGGSSPRVWGAQHSLQSQGRAGRLIPTCVGSTRSPSQPSPGTPAHPHVCGEHMTCTPRVISPPGSSPRVWGARRTCSKFLLAVRLIPTCVGSTLRTLPRKDSSAAHPHVCGEHGRVVYWGDQKSGSSPRVWGALQTGSVMYTRSRLIPTCVGSTRS